MFISHVSPRARRYGVLVLSVAAFGLFIPGVSTQSARFYSDDPIAREPESQDASATATYDHAQMYELVFNLFINSGHKPSGVRAKNINTIDEVPDSSWFTDRIGAGTLTTEELVRGPNLGAPPDPSKWVLIREKTSGVHPGFTAIDARGETWFLQFDPVHFPEGATAAVAIASKVFWALGYNQVESFLTTFDPRKSSIDPKATIRRPNGQRTPFTQDDVNAVLENCVRNPDGTYRVIAGRLLPGKILGPFPVRRHAPDDPNDIVPHEHRRELRALRVFGAWTNLTDLKAQNTLDTLVTENGRTVVKHYLQDVGSTFGMCNDFHEWDLSYEYFFEGGPSRKRLFTLGFGLSPWQTVDYVEYPSVGKFEGKVFDPRTWRAQTPTLAYMELRDDDAFWAARRIAAFTDDMIRAVVQNGTVQQSSRRGVPRRRADPASGQDQERLLDADQSDRRPAPRCQRTDVSKRCGRGRRRTRPGGIPGLVDALRQHDRCDPATGRHEERNDDDCGAGRSAVDWFRCCGHRRRQRCLPDVEQAGPCLLQPEWRKLEAGRIRPHAGHTCHRQRGAENLSLAPPGGGYVTSDCSRHSLPVALRAAPGRDTRSAESFAAGSRCGAWPGGRHHLG